MRRRTDQPLTRRAGLTLAELSVSLAVIATLMVAIGSVMVLTGRAVAMTATQADEARVDDLVGQIGSELRLALTVTERKPTTITFTVADRDGDRVPERIRYSWSGVKGDPLYRKVNDQAAVVAAKAVTQFRMGYLTKSAAPAPVSDVEIASDVVLYEQLTGSAARAVSSTSWAAQYFKPNWATVAPGRTVKNWKVTKVEIVASKAVGSSGAVPWVVRVFAAGSDLKPLAPKLGEATLLPTTSTASPSVLLPVGPIAFSPLLGASDGAVVTVGPQAGSPAGYVGFRTQSTAAGEMLTSSNGGLTWSAPGGTTDLRIRVWGRYTYPG